MVAGGGGGGRGGDHGSLVGVVVGMRLRLTATGLLRLRDCGIGAGKVVKGRDVLVVEEKWFVMGVSRREGLISSGDVDQPPTEQFSKWQRTGDKKVAGSQLGLGESVRLGCSLGEAWAKYIDQIATQNSTRLRFKGKESGALLHYFSELTTI